MAGLAIFPLPLNAEGLGHGILTLLHLHQCILAGFREHGIDMPFPPFQMRLESLDGLRSSQPLNSAGKSSRTPGSL